MVSLSYTDEEFLDLICCVNELEPYAFYIVDSFGMMKRKDLTRLFYLVEHNLNENIKIGFHSHNNMQLAYSNAQSLVDLHSDRELIIDASVYGMGRGAGNLNTELFVQYLNDNADGKYDIKPLLSIIDEILNEFYQRNYWGYSLPNYLSAVHNAHPNYAGYLDDKKTLTVENMNEIFEMMDEDKKVSYDKDYIEELYLRYMATGKSQEEHKTELIENLNGKTVLLIAPGKSSIEEKDRIASFMNEDVVMVSVNYNYPLVNIDYAELKWSSAEALKLAVWLVSHANSDFYRESIPIENASQEIIDKYLEELWGLKLGKKDSNEAYSSRWILAALSDFNGQLQARDIIRFLKYAAGQNMKKPPYDDRILMPAEIRYAVPKCSNAKISDIKAEYENLKPIFEKLEDLPTDEKTLPMNLENNIFTSAEEKSMTQSGYLKRDGEKLYLPEIIRHALGFRYEKGARPRVLSLLLKH